MVRFDAPLFSERKTQRTRCPSLLPKDLAIRPCGLRLATSLRKVRQLWLGTATFERSALLVASASVEPVSSFMVPDGFHIGKRHT